jgi:hypothetical protein
VQFVGRGLTARRVGTLDLFGLRNYTRMLSLMSALQVSLELIGV